MFLPYGDTPNPPTTPFINYFFIAANIAVFLFVTLPLTMSRPDFNDPLVVDYIRVVGARGYGSAQQILQNMTAYDLFVFRYGFRPGSPSLFTLFSSMFLHGGWLHLIGNMVFLWIFGDNVEHRLGRFGYLGFYLVAGVAATLFFSLFVPGSQVPLVGASGAISGVLGCYFIWFPRNQVKTFVFLFPILMNTFYLPARLVLGFYLVIDNIIPFLFTAGQASGVAHGAHIGGFGAGLLLAFAVDRWQWIGYKHRSRVKDITGGPAERKETVRETTEAQRVVELLGENLMDRATDLYFQLDDRKERLAVPDEAVLDMGNNLLEQGKNLPALSLFRRFIAERPNSPEIDRAFLGAGEAMLRQPRGDTSAYHYFLTALDTARTEQTAKLAREYLRRLDRRAR
ncbi:MAG: rhomboid family intramembrane serine protease [Syntrophotaleaceae bacterium]